MRLIIKKGIFIFVALQLCVIAYLFTQLYRKINATKPKKINQSSEVKGLRTRIQTGNLKYFYELKGNQRIEDHKDWITEIPVYTTNGDGLNERFDYKIGAQDNTFRIVTLGDSFTFGALINTADNWTELLEDKLNSEFSCKNFKKIEVINLAMYGYDIEYAVERYRIRGQKYDPNLILWMLVDNKRILEKLLPLKDSCVKKSGGKLDDEGLNYKCWARSLEQYMDELGEKKISEILTEKFSGIFKYYDKDLVAIDLDGGHYQILRNITQTKKPYVYNIDFWNKKDLELPDGHPNKQGHKYFADNIYDYLLNNKIIPCD